jgi:hypothetical protein
VKTFVEAGHSINRQELNQKFAIAMISIIASNVLLIVGCSVSDLNLHVKEGALGQASLSPKATTNLPVAPLP